MEVFLHQEQQPLRFVFLIVVSMTLVSCSSMFHRDPAATVSSTESSDTRTSQAAELDKDEEVEEIDEISQMPKTSHDYEDSEDLAQIPVEINSLVVKWVNYFQGRGRKHMERYLSRSSRYLPMMKTILKDRGLPEDLVYVALIESGFSPTALSHAGAVGYWQFMRGTGRDYGLKINSHIDERRDPILSTQAAADYFSGLYNLFGSWYLAIASYNVGENKIKRLVMKHHTRDFWQLISRGRMPAETINYVPKFLAASLIAKNPGKYGFSNIDYAPPFAFEEIKVTGAISLHKLATGMKIEKSELRALNPAFKTDYALASQGTSFMLRVPVGRSDDGNRILATAAVRSTRAILAAGRASDGPSYVRYKIRRGDTLTEVAARYNVSLSQIAKANKLSTRANLIMGKNLLIPQGNLRSRAVAELKSTARSTSHRSKRNVSKVYVVRRGDTLTGIARKYRVPMREIATANNMRIHSRILVGEQIQIPD